MNATTPVNFISGNTYSDADPAAEAAAKSSAGANAPAHPEAARKPAEWPAAEAYSTVRAGVVVDLATVDGDGTE